MSTNHAPARGTVVITGTSRGIGFHLARRFLAEGYAVTGISRTEAQIDHPNFRSLTADIGDINAVKAISHELAEQPIVGLINNAGFHGPIGPFENAPIEEWVGTFNANLFGAAALSQACISALRERNGFIIFFSGGGSAFPRSNFSAYGVSKGAIIRLSEVLAKELAPNVFVYCVAPGPNRTVLLEEAVCSGETVRDEDIVDFEYPERLCLFLANNRDPRYSGKFIHVMDSYEEWSDAQLDDDAYTLRRIDPRTLQRVNLT